MPRLSLYKPEKGPDFRFLDRVINEQFQVGGTDILVHKYLGPVDPATGEVTETITSNTNYIKELGIQDVLFMENRDRHYDPDLYTLRGIYTMQDIDFNLSQFGLFLQNDNIMITLHLRNTFDTLGRKVMPGDVLELPHLKDEYALNDATVALKRFYVITDVTRPASGYSQTWYPHLLRAKCQPLVDSQEFAEILNQDSGAEDGSTLRDVLSNYNKNIEINNQILAQAESDAPHSGYDTQNFYVLPKREDGTLDVADTTAIDADASTDNPVMDASIVLRSPDREYYVGYLTENGIPPNGAPYTFGITFPVRPVVGQFHLRNDFLPTRMFRFDGKHWVKFEDNVQMSLTNTGENAETFSQNNQGAWNSTVAYSVGNIVQEGNFQYKATGPVPVGSNPKESPTFWKQIQLTQKGTFINNNKTDVIAGKLVPERQPLSKALRPKADN